MRADACGQARPAAEALRFNIETIVCYVSQYVTLLPGDVIYTGTQGSTTALKPGDVVEVEVDGVGALRNTVARRSDPIAPPRRRP